MNDFVDEEEDTNPKERHRKEVLSRRTEDQKTALIREALKNLREELNG